MVSTTVCAITLYLLQLLKLKFSSGQQGKIAHSEVNCQFGKGIYIKNTELHHPGLEFFYFTLNMTFPSCQDRFLI